MGWIQHLYFKVGRSSIGTVKDSSLNMSLATITRYAIYQLRLYSSSLIHILSLSNSHNNLALIQKNRGDKSHRVIVAFFKIGYCIFNLQENERHG